MSRFVCVMLGALLGMLGCVECCAGNDGDTLRIKVPAKTMHIIMPDSLPVVGFFTDDSDIFSNNGLLKMYSLETGQLLWQEKFPLKGTLLFETNLGLAISNGNGKFKLFDYISGYNVIAEKGSYASTVPHSSVMLVNHGRNKLRGYDLSSGRIRWESNIHAHNNMPLHLIKQLNDSVAIYLGNNLIQLNTSNGNCKIIDLTRTANYYNIYSFGRLFFGVPYMVVFPEKLKEIGSDVVSYQDSIMYLSDYKTVRCVDCGMNEIWKVKLPYQTGGNSAIALKGDSLRMIGYGDKVNGVIVGKPFLASFDRLTGKQHFLKTFDRRMNTDLFGDRFEFVTDPFYAYNHTDSTYRKYQISVDTVMIKAANNDILVFDCILNPVGRIAAADVWYEAYYSCDDLILVNITDKKNPKAVRLGADGREAGPWDINRRVYRGYKGVRYVSDGKYLTRE